MSPNNLLSFKGSSTISTMFPRKPSSAIVLQIHRRPYFKSHIEQIYSRVLIGSLSLIKTFLSIEEQAPSMNLGQASVSQIGSPPGNGTGKRLFKGYLR